MTISSINSYTNYNMNMNTESKINISSFKPNEGMPMGSEESASAEIALGQSTMSLEDMQESMTKQGPNNGPPPPPPPGDDMISSMIDSDEDDLWSVDELSDFSESLISTIETSFDVEEIMDKYDIDGDGNIDATERAAMKEDNAFNLVPQEETQASEEVNAESNVSNYFMEKAVQAYDFSSNLQEKFPINIFDSKVV